MASRLERVDAVALSSRTFAIRGMAMDEGMLGGAPNSAIPIIPRKKLGAKDAEVRAAGMMITTPTGQTLFLKRSGKGDHEGEWCLPGGGIEDGEKPLDAALRETKEETGWKADGEPEEVDTRISDEGVDFTTYALSVRATFMPMLDDEHVGYAWAPSSDPPQPLHPGVAATLGKLALDEAAESGASRKLLRETIKYPPPKLPGAKDDERAIDLSFKRGGAGKTLKESPQARHFGLTSHDLAPGQISSSEMSRFRAMSARQQAEVISLLERIKALKGRDPEKAAQIQKQVDRIAGDDWQESKHPRGQPGNAGQFGSAGSASPRATEGEAKTGSPGFAAKGLEASDDVKKRWAKESPIKTVDDLYVRAQEHQDALDQVGKSVQVEVDEGTQFKTPGIKGKPRVEEKVQQGKPPS